MGIDSDPKRGATEAQNDSDLRTQAEVAIGSNNYDEALHIARRIQNDSTRDDLLKSIVEAQIGASQIDAAIETARKIKSEYSRDGANAIIVKALANVGRFEEARAAIKGGARSRDGYLEIAKALINAGRFEEVQAIIDKSQGKYDWDWYREIGVALANAGRFEEAESITDKIVNEEYGQASRDWVFYTIAMAQVKAGKTEEARATASNIRHPYWHRENRDLKQEVYEAILRAESKPAEEIEVENEMEAFKERASLEAQRVETLAKAGSFDEAKSQAAKIMDREHREDALQTTAVCEANAGRIDEAKSTALKIKDQDVRNSTYIAIAVELSAAGKFDEARSITSNIKDKNSSGKAWGAIAAALAKAGRFDEAITVALQIKDQWNTSNRNAALNAIIEAQMQAEQFDRALATIAVYGGGHWETVKKIVATQIEAGKIRELVTAVKNIAHKAHREDDFRHEIIKALSNTGHFDAAKDIAKEIRDSDQRGRSYATIIAALAKAGQFDEAQSMISDIKRKDIHDEACVAIVKALITAQRFDEATIVARGIKDSLHQVQIRQQIAEVEAKAAALQAETAGSDETLAAPDAHEDESAALSAPAKQISKPASSRSISVPKSAAAKPREDGASPDFTPTDLLASSFTDAFRGLAGVAEAPAEPIAARTTQPVERVQIEGEEPIAPEPKAPQAEAGEIDKAKNTAGEIKNQRVRDWTTQEIARAQAQAGLHAATARVVTAVRAGIKPAAIPPPVPADAEPTIRSTAQFSGVQPRTVVPPPTLEETLIAREVAGRMAGLFPAFPESGPGELQDALLDDDAGAFDSSTTMIGGPGAAQTLEVSGEIDSADHARTVIWRPENLTRPSGDVEDDAQTRVWRGMPGLTKDENGWMAEGDALPQDVEDEASWTSRLLDKVSSVLHSTRSVMETLGQGISAAWQSASQQIAGAYSKVREGFREFRESAGRKIGQWGAQIEGARRARQIRLPAAESAEGQTVIVNRPGRSFLRSPFAWVIGGGAIAAGAFVLNARISEIRRGEELAESVRGPQVSAPAQLPEVVHAQTPKIPTLGPSAAPPERPMPQAAAKPQPKAPPEEPRPQPAAVPPPPKAAAPEKSPPRTINLDCAVLDGFPACYLPDDTSGARKPMDLNMKKDDREPAQTAGDIRGRLSVVLQGLGIEFVSRKPVEFRPGEASKPFGRIEFVERGK